MEVVGEWGEGISAEAVTEVTVVFRRSSTTATTADEAGMTKLWPLRTMGAERIGMGG